MSDTYCHMPHARVHMQSVRGTGSAKDDHMNLYVKQKHGEGWVYMLDAEVEFFFKRLDVCRCEAGVFMLKTVRV